VKKSSEINLNLSYVASGRYSMALHWCLTVEQGKVVGMYVVWI